jgi:DMSO/TMAO reductase YedYZ molybdopterin-dependent catalytic subunit
MVDEWRAELEDISRRYFLRLLTATAFGGLTAACQKQQASLISVPAGQTVERYPEKTELILLTDRPPQLETPLCYFRQDLTPNEAFFVRWHHSGIPTSIDLRTFRLNVGGHTERQLSLSVDDLKSKFEPVTLVAVNQCSGNSRSFFEPRVPGGQWANGAMGNARWKGAPLKDILNAAGVKAGAVDVAVSGLDEPPLSSMKKFVKALSIEHALSDVLVAYEMNDAPLPLLNGFPLRLVVPGWYATYWIKSLAHVEVLSAKFQGFWMDKAYRIPKNADASETPENLAKDTVPINRMNVRSLIIRPDLTDVVRAGRMFEIEGIAFDGGSGIAGVQVSVDGGASWSDAKLDSNDLGRFSFRRWRLAWTPASAGHYSVMVRAVSNSGEKQNEHVWNKSGYMRNVVERIEVPVV